jgi:hypothetical protein
MKWHKWGIQIQKPVLSGESGNFALILIWVLQALVDML